MYLGDIEKGRVLRGKFNTSAKATGAGITIGGTPSVVVYKDNSTTEITSGIVLTIDFDSRTGFHHWSVDTSGSDYTAGSDYAVVVTGGTVDGESINGKVLREFSLQNRFIRSEPPTQTSNATAVRTELAAELAKISATDTRTSSIYTVVQLTDADVASIKSTVQGLVVSIWSYGSRTLTTFADSSGVTSLLSRVTGLLRTKAEDETAESVLQVGLVDGAISAGKIASNAITASKIAPDAFTSNKFASGSLNGKGDWATSVGGSNGLGDRKITFTATDGTNNIRNVKIGIAGSDTLAYTGVMGTAELNVDPNSTYSIYVTPPAEFQAVDNFSLSVVASDVAHTITLTPVFRPTVPAPDGFCNLEFDVRSQSGNAAAVTVSYELASKFRIKSGNVNVNTDGLASPTGERVSLNLIQGLVYVLKIYKGNEKVAEFKVSVPRATYYLLTEAIAT